MLTVVMLRAMASKVYSDGYSDAEAYPQHLWRNNGWPTMGPSFVDQAAFKLMNAAIAMWKAEETFIAMTSAGRPW